MFIPATIVLKLGSGLEGGWVEEKIEEGKKIIMSQKQLKQK